MKRGIRFADDPAFRGAMRELVAEDYVYSIKRSLDPNLRNGGDATLTDLLEGARPVVDAARKAGGKFDYDARIPGLVATDRHTLTIRLTRPDFTVLERLAVLPSFAVAREVVEAAGKDVVSKPVGTGPFVLKQWTRASRVVLEANPGYESATHTVRGAALAPIAVHPSHQRLGIGGALIHMSLAMLAHEGVEAVVVLGHADYYPRFGFSADLAARLDTPFNGPHLMAMELEPGSIDGLAARPRYARAFGV